MDRDRGTNTYRDSWTKTGIGIRTVTGVETDRGTDTQERRQRERNSVANWDKSWLN